MRVVHSLKAIEVKHEYCHLTRLAGGTNARIKFFGEQPTVRQPSQRVVPSQTPRLSIATNPANQHADIQNEHHKDYVIDFPVSAINRKLKHLWGKVIEMGHERRENRNPEKEDDVPCGRTTPVKPMAGECV